MLSELVLFNVLLTSRLSFKREVYARSVIVRTNGSALSLKETPRRDEAQPEWLDDLRCSIPVPSLLSHLQTTGE